MEGGTPKAEEGAFGVTEMFYTLVVILAAPFGCISICCI